MGTKKFENFVNLMHCKKDNFLYIRDLYSDVLPVTQRSQGCVKLRSRQDKSPV